MTLEIEKTMEGKIVLLITFTLLFVFIAYILDSNVNYAKEKEYEKMINQKTNELYAEGMIDRWEMIRERVMSENSLRDFVPKRKPV